MFGPFLVDLIVLLALAYYAFHGYRRGFLLIFLELGFFLVALGIAVGLHRAAAGVLSAAFGISELVGRPLCLLSILGGGSNSRHSCAEKHCQPNSG